MNIYALDESPQQLVSYLTDRHLASAMKNAAQMMCAAHVKHDGISRARLRIPGLMVPANLRMATMDPWTIWCMQRAANYEWLWRVLAYGCDEFLHRAGHSHAFAIDGQFDWSLRRQLAYPPLALASAMMLWPWRQPLPINVPMLYARDTAVESYRLWYSQRYANGDDMEWHGCNKPPQWMKRTGVDCEA